MLVLTRKIGEAIVIGDHIKVVVNRVRGAAVSIGIDAPREVRIVREELTASGRQDKGGSSEAANL